MLVTVLKCWQQQIYDDVVGKKEDFRDQNGQACHQHHRFVNNILVINLNVYLHLLLSILLQP